MQPGFRSTPWTHCAKFWWWRHHYDADFNIIVKSGENMKNFKHSAILLTLILLTCSFSLNKSQTLKAVTLIFWNTQYHFIIRVFGIPYSTQSHDIGSTSDFRISGRSLIKRNCHNTRVSDDIDMKLGPVTKFDKRNNVKKFDGDVMSEDWDFIEIFPIYS